MDEGLNDVDLLLEPDPDSEGEDDLPAISAKEISGAVVTSTDWTAETILSQLRRGTIELNPNFQRRNAWSPPRQSAFIESLFLALPIPQLVLAERADERGTYLVIDGKQRLVTLLRFGSHLVDSGDGTISPLILTGLKERPDLNGHSLAELEADPKFRGDVTSFLNQTVRTVVVRNWPNEAFLYLVFHRLNTGSVPLSPQELRQALHPGRFVQFADEFSLGSMTLQGVLGRREPDFRMRDVELLVRYFAFGWFLERYTGNLKEALDYTCKTLNRRWDREHEKIEVDALRCERAIEVTERIFADSAFRRWTGSKFETRFNRTVFDIMTYYFKDQEVAALAEENADSVVSAYKRLSDDSEFSQSLQATTKTVHATYTRIGRWGEALSSVLETPVSVPSRPT
jgi:hypothetical protein